MPGDHQLTLLGSFVVLPTNRSRHSNHQRLPLGSRLLLRSQAARFWNRRQRVERCLSGWICCMPTALSPSWPVRPALVHTVYDLSFAEHPDCIDSPTVWVVLPVCSGLRLGLIGLWRYPRPAAAFCAISTCRLSGCGHLPGLSV